MNMGAREESYDELLILARDARTSRKRTNYWTTGLVITAMGASGAYVGTVNQQINELSESVVAAEIKNDTLQSEYARLIEERSALKIERDVYMDFAKQFGDMYPMLKLAEAMPKVISTGEPVIVDPPPQVTQYALSNVVWVVDGTRRLPMTDGDILWIPEGRFWIRKETKNGQDVLTYHEERPAGAASPGVDMTLPDQRTIDRGSFNCLEISMHPRSNRPIFIDDPDYVDVEVMYSRNQNCRP